MSTKKQETFEDRLLNEREAAAFLGMAQVTLRLQRYQGAKPGGMPALPYHKLGKAVRYSLADLREVVKASRVEG